MVPSRFDSGTLGCICENRRAIAVSATPGFAWIREKKDFGHGDKRRS
jgi:hypothetical protein